MTVDPGPYDMDAVRPVLGPTGAATPKAVTPDFYRDLDRDFGGFAGHILVSKHDFAEAWGVWEMHPKGDEVVYLLSGAVDFVLWTGQGERLVRLDRPGTYVVVPRGTWHTARPLRPSAMLFLTPGEDTRHAEKPGAA